MRHYVPKTVMIEYYGSNNNPILSIFVPFMTQNKINRLILFFKRKNESIRQNFNDEKFLIAQELHVYELLKFVQRSIAELHSENFWNELFVFDIPSYMTKKSTLDLMKVPNLKSKIRRDSFNCRGAKRFNLCRLNSLIPKAVSKS